MDPFHLAAEAIKSSGLTVAVTGAGISAESGIPTFRGDDGIWLKYPPNEYATIDAYNANPDKVWKFWLELGAKLGGSRPNPAHHALAELEAMGKLEAIITQNIDNLHQAAGSKNVIEYHGNAHWLVCPRCRHRDPLDLSQQTDSPPYCFCGTLMKPDVVMFGEAIPSQALVDSARLAETCNVLIVVGTSAQVYPAARLPVLARQSGAFIIEANIEETDFTTSVTHVFLRGPAGETLPKLIECVKT
ncbi:MAG TPA: NAD-dependent deacylase [Candidatus Hydrogenedentes bacterium]|nr:NAD-dependent deacylase [Candidatus Hydrogenedentota bacterium]HOV73719.1 NAD-dependent deacylase [Candidatus Hydrogenedentota bacterium]HPC17100.1 NAD-dependent deacylase [Candidatus Hydrogenedentota bacterium]HRT20517.1 NAD-dependent deacylase [Candidatus Hydrogenedentota bacterium]HRT65278.1 NAD-dependent deacylase [Candidatus Hydrogenedentota bacterium]